MFKWLDRRKKFRRDDDLKDRLEKAIEEKHRASLEALERLNQFRADRRFHILPVDFERRRV